MLGSPEEDATEDDATEENVFFIFSKHEKENKRR
jgi:hypothetical protein